MANFALAAPNGAALGSADNGKNLDSRAARMLEKFIRRVGAYGSKRLLAGLSCP